MPLTRKQYLWKDDAKFTTCVATELLFVLTNVPSKPGPEKLTTTTTTTSSNNKNIANKNKKKNYKNNNNNNNIKMRKENGIHFELVWINK